MPAALDNAPKIDAMKAMDWTVKFTVKAGKQAAKLPQAVHEALRLLVADIRAAGPVRGNWPNYGKLGRDRHHCHLKKGRPTYVAVWQSEASAIRLVEVIYVGTHGKAPY